MKSEHRSFVIYRRNTDEQYGGYNKSLKRMLTKSCVMFFFWPSRAVLTLFCEMKILTSAVRTNQGDKAGRNQLPARDRVLAETDAKPVKFSP